MNSRNVGKAAVGTMLIALAFAGPAFAGRLLVTGQTASYQADKNDGVDGPVDVSDDGALQLGKPLKYKLRKDGTVEDLKTGLIWEVQCDGCGGLHDFTFYVWSGDGTQETIWDWLDKVNAEGGAGYAGHHDWRIPNVRELESIVDYGVSPAINPIFGPTATTCYWSSTTVSALHDFAWTVEFFIGQVNAGSKDGVGGCLVRAVRGRKK